MSVTMTVKVTVTSDRISFDYSDIDSDGESEKWQVTSDCVRCSYSYSEIDTDGESDTDNLESDRDSNTQCDKKL